MSLGSGAQSQCGVSISPAAPSGGAAIALSSNNSLLKVPVSVLVPAGASSISFTATAGTVSTSQTAVLTASLNGSSKTASYTLSAPAKMQAKIGSELAEQASNGPTIREGGVVNTASDLPGSSLYGGLAQGSLFTIFGSGLGPDPQVAAQGSPYPTTLGGVSVAVTSGTRRYAAGLLLVSHGQINAILPAELPIGRAQVVVSYDGLSSGPAAVEVSKTSIGVFQHEVDGQPAAVAQSVRSDGNRMILPATPAQPGDVVELWITGLGAEPESTPWRLRWMECRRNECIRTIHRRRPRQSTSSSRFQWASGSDARFRFRLRRTEWRRTG